MTAEIVAVSFHYAQKMERSGDEPELGKFSKADLKNIAAALEAKQNLNFKDPKVEEALRNKRYSPVEHFEWLSSKEMCGEFWATYSGHEYENLDVGTITAGSVSLRKFYFHIYLADSGTIYIGVQYLGLYGGYTQFKATIEDALRGENHYPEFGSINSSDVDLSKATIEEIQVTWAKGSQSVDTANSFGQTGILTVKRNKDGSNTEALDTAVKERIMKGVKGSDAAKSKHEVSQILQENKLLKLKDEEISDVSLLVSIDKRKRRIRLIEASGLATRFPIHVTKLKNGHPKYEEVKAQTLRLLSSKIIKIAEDV